ncbi:MAG: hypothetical protein J2P44_05305, partial [Candidatus Dormibacteraeota bacterium]|nr:hypothetical protein [Candidatus Dormibacteraeota bacterium]
MVLLRGRGLDLFAVALCVPLLVLAIAAHGVTARAATASWPVDNLGQPVQRALSTDTALGVTPDGDP